jgi:hypothetical protein
MTSSSRVKIEIDANGTLRYYKKSKEPFECMLTGCRVYDTGTVGFLSSEKAIGIICGENAKPVMLDCSLMNSRQYNELFGHINLLSKARSVPDKTA